MHPSDYDILIAEDNQALLRVTEFAVSRAGYRVQTAKNGELALEKLGQTQFDLVITDHQMPRMTGVELVRAARELEGYRQTPFVLLTAKALELSHEHLAEELGVAKVLSKPFSPSEITVLVHQLLARNQATCSS